MFENYRNIYVFGEKTIEEPSDGAHGEEEWQEERHKLHAFCAYDKPL